MDQLPEVDSAKVAEIKAALADGSIKFDAGKLAGLIQRYHGGRG
jgi:negative regulator of flagellin synthesis FlgM